MFRSPVLRRWQRAVAATAAAVPGKRHNRDAKQASQQEMERNHTAGPRGTSDAGDNHLLQSSARLHGAL